MTPSILRSSPFVGIRREPHSVELSRMMRDLLRWDPLGMPAFETARVAAFSPDFEIRETKEAYVFRADLPGVEENALDISVTEDRLTVSGSREAEEEKETEAWHARERSYGSFTRAFALPDGVDVDAAAAGLKNGVLTITLPKKAAAKPRKLDLTNGGAIVREASAA